MEKSSISLLYRCAKDIGLELDQSQLGAFSAFGDLLIERGKYMNLTSIKDEYGIVVKHFLDSLSPAVHVRELARLLGEGSGDSGDGGGDRGGCEYGDSDDGSGWGDGVSDFGGGSDRGRDSSSPAALIDIGAGAGFPGIPLKILYSDKLDVTFIDSVGKKVNFINEAISVLGLSDCAAHHARAEDAARDAGLRGRFDFAASRAVADIHKIYDYSMPFLRDGGIMIAMKGRRKTVEKELAATSGKPGQGRGHPFRIIQFELSAPSQPETNGDSIAGDSIAGDGIVKESIALDASYERTLVVATKNSHHAIGRQAPHHKPKNSKAR
ncbi:MAG: 16S rRNA (guanine(527)-N(7))-methyltransferase RsmG [Oscillospiraceae bacterium]|nr:16S rRNA (guanine(527)-N(7))-methyltransferase RsmG [Oscillospiraceae bacterium]